MRSIKEHEGLVVAINQANIDTDQIIPKQFLKRVERTGYGQFLFFDYRFEQDGSTLKKSFILNDSAYKGASILVANKNFGSGSSREHAAWALDDFGFRVIIAPSFADIFYNNCFQNGMLPVILAASEVDYLIAKANMKNGYRLHISLEKQTVSDNENFNTTFEIEDFHKNALLKGLDAIGITLGKHQKKIHEYEVNMYPSWQIKLKRK